MPIFFCKKVAIEYVRRLAWLVTVLIFLGSVLAPYFLLSYLASQGIDKLDDRINYLELLIIVGGLSSLSFFIVAYRFNGNKTAPGTTPTRMCSAIISGLVFTLIYWVLYFYLTQSHDDGDGIMRGWMCILYPFILVKMVIRFSRGG